MDKDAFAEYAKKISQFHQSIKMQLKIKA